MISSKVRVEEPSCGQPAGVPLFINLGDDDLSEQDVTLLRNAHVAILQKY
jgi:hypothetical protein